VGFLSYLMLAESLSAAKVVGLFLGFSGVVVVSVGSLSEASLGTPLGVAFGVASAVSWALGTVYFKKYGENLSTLWAVGGPFLLGGICLTGLAFCWSLCPKSPEPEPTSRAGSTPRSWGRR
jgi:drug/metabolite transporter (DMT)-like permease